MPAHSDKPQFLLLLHQPNTGTAPSPEEMQRIMARFKVWMDGLKANGLVLGTNGLDTGGKILRGPRGISITDGPFAESKEIIGGYVLITADNLDHAVKCARDCPGLDHRMAVEVRPVIPRRET